MITRTSEQPKKPIKLRLCGICRQEYRPWRSIQPTCGERACEHAYAMRTVEKAARKRNSAEKLLKKAERAAIKARKEKIKTIADWRREAQSAVNAVRRFEDEEDGFPCISCGRYHQGQYHAGHYLSRGAHPELALEPLNIFRQCAPCNTHLSGNQIKMRQGIIDRYGVERVEWLEGKHEPVKHSIDDLKNIIKTYRLKLRELLRASA